MLRIENVVNFNLPKPEEDDPTYDTWHYWSICTLGWISSRLDDEITTILEGSIQQFPEYADDLMKEITRIVSGDNKVLNVGAEALKFNKMKRDNYTTAKDYIMAY
jgi:hypothetical protein